MKFIRWALPVLSLVWLSPAFAQSNVLLNFQTPTGPTQASAVNPLPVSGSFSAGTFAPVAYAHLTATGSSSASTALPTNTGVVVITNEGTTPVSCTLASGSATGVVDNIVVAPGNGGRGVAVGSNDHIACIDQNAADSTSNLVVIEGGSGLPAGWGGGGGGSGGAVTIAERT